MKKIILSLLTMIAMTAFFASCSDDEKPKGGSFTFEGDKVVLKHGYYYDDGSYGSGDEIYNDWYITLTSDGLTYDEEQEFITGEGDAIVFGLSGFNIGEDEVPTGTFSSEGSEGENGLYSLYLYNISDNFDYTSFDDGEVTISKSGSTYTIVFSFTNNDDQTVSGTFRGTLSYGYIPS